MGIASITDISAASLKSFEVALSRYFFTEEIDFNKKAIVERIDEFIDATNKINEIGKREAEMICLAKDLSKVRANILKLPFENNIQNLERFINKSLKIVKEETGIDLEVKYFIVNDFPPPFERKPFSIMVFDSADQKKYDIEPGIYFREDAVLPYRSAMGALHEIIHLIISLKEPSRLARGLEDGICDYLGPLYIGSKIIDTELCLNYIKNRRLSSRVSKISLRYQKNLQQASVLYLLGGFNSLWFLAKNGRKMIENVEKYLLKGEIEILQNILPKRDKTLADSKIDKFSYTTLVFENTLSVSPLALLIAERLEEKDKLNHFKESLKFDKTDFENAILELTNADTYLMIRKGDEITCNKAKIYIEANMLRWDVSE